MEARNFDVRRCLFISCIFGFHISALRFDDAPANPEEAQPTLADSKCEKKLQTLEEEVLRFCHSEQEGLKNGQYKWLTHVRDVNATEMARNVMHALRWGKRDASHGLLFTKKTFYDRNSTLLLWSGVSPRSREKWCKSLNMYMLHAGGNDDIQTPFGIILEKIKGEDDDRLLQGCEWTQQEPIWQAASDAVVWRSGDSLVRLLLNKSLKGNWSLRESVFYRAELPALARYPPEKGFRVLNEHPHVKCRHLMPIVKAKIESNGLLDDWRKVKTFSCVDVLQVSAMSSSELEHKHLDSKATEFLKPGEQLAPECGMNKLTLQSYQDCRVRGQIDFSFFQMVAGLLPSEHTPKIGNLRLPQLSIKYQQLPAILPDIAEMFHTSIPSELCLLSISLGKLPEDERRAAEETLRVFVPKDVERACREGAEELLPELRKALEDSEGRVRKSAAEALLSISKEAPEVAMPALWEVFFLGGCGKWDHCEVAEALGSIGKEAPEAVLPELRRALGASTSVCRSAAIALASIGKAAKEAVPELRKAFNAGKGWPLRTGRFQIDFIKRALASIGEEAKEALPDLVKAFDPKTPKDWELDRTVGSIDFVYSCSWGDGWQAAEAMGQFEEPSEAALSQLRRALGNSDKAVRTKAAFVLGSWSKELPEAVLELKRALGDSDKRERQRAAKALARSGKTAKEAVPELRKVLGDPDRNIRRIAAATLGRLGKEAKEAVPELRKALGDPALGVRRSAAEALGRLGKEAKEAVPDLWKVFFLKCSDCTGGEEYDLDVLIAIAAEALGSIGTEAPEAVLPELRKALDDSSIWVRKEAVNAMRVMAGKAPEAVLPELRKALGDSNCFVRQGTAKALGSIGKAAVPELRRALHDSYSQVRRNAVKALLSICKEEPQVVLPELRRALADSDKHVRAVAIEALVSMGRKTPEAVLPELQKALSVAFSDSDSFVRSRAVDALGFMGTEAVLPELLKALGDSDKWVRASAAEALSFFGKEAAKKAVPQLLQALLDRDREVRQRVAQALGSIGREAPEAVLGELLPCFADVDDFRFRSPEFLRGAVEAFGYMGKEAKEAVPTLLKDVVYCRFEEVANSSAEALRRIWTESKEAVPQLELQKALIEHRSCSRHWRR
ncbi:ILA [Symbiodinium sp. CCMP2592]|nr:ILA [Symbiodinium sp. CCMP2592]